MSRSGAASKAASVSLKRISLSTLLPVADPRSSRAFEKGFFMKRDHIRKNLVLGAAAGLAGTGLMQGMMAATQKFTPQFLPPMRDNPDHFIVKQAERLLPQETQKKIPEKLETAAQYTLAFGYGMTLTSLYALARRERANVWLDGTALGLSTWAIGYLGWLPATKLTLPIWKQKPKQILPGILSHVIFGIAAIGLFSLARRKI